MMRRFIKKTNSSMNRKEFVVCLPLIPWVIPGVLKGLSPERNKLTELIGLGNSGYWMAEGVKELGFTGIVKSVQMPERNIIMGDAVKDGLVENKELRAEVLSIIRKTTQQDRHFIFIGGLGGRLTNYLIANTYAEMKKSNCSYQFILTSPFKFEGHAKNQRANKLTLAMDNDPRVHIIQLEEFKKIYGGSETLSNVFIKHIPETINKIIQKTSQ